MTRHSVRFLIAASLVMLFGGSPVVHAQDSDAESAIEAQQTNSVELELYRKLPPPPHSRELVKVGSLKPSFYWIAMETHDGEPKDQPLLDVDGNHMVSVSASFLKKLKMEGTGKLLDGRIINFKARIEKPDGTKEIRYRWCGHEAPYGFGWQDLPLVPFHSLAVDPSVIPIGSKVYVPAARGAVLPDGSVHDGMFTALDIGDAIQNKRIDVFTSFGDQSIVFGRVGMEHMKAVDVFLVK